MLSAPTIISLPPHAHYLHLSPCVLTSRSPLLPAVHSHLSSLCPFRQRLIRWSLTYQQQGCLQNPPWPQTGIWVRGWGWDMKGEQSCFPCSLSERAALQTGRPSDLSPEDARLSLAQLLWPPGTPAAPKVHPDPHSRLFILRWPVVSCGYLTPVLRVKMFFFSPSSFWERNSSGCSGSFSLLKSFLVKLLFTAYYNQFWQISGWAALVSSCAEFIKAADQIKCCKRATERSLSTVTQTSRQLSSYMLNLYDCDTNNITARFREDKITALSWYCAIAKTKTAPSRTFLPRSGLSMFFS